jgi:SelR domain
MGHNSGPLPVAPGWPSFTAPVEPGNVARRRDFKMLFPRSEVRSAHGGSHLGHVFHDGPREAGGLRYCINSAALRSSPSMTWNARGVRATAPTGSPLSRPTTAAPRHDDRVARLSSATDPPSGASRPPRSSNPRCLLPTVLARRIRGQNARAQGNRLVVNPGQNHGVWQRTSGLIIRRSWPPDTSAPATVGTRNRRSRHGQFPWAEQRHYRPLTGPVLPDQVRHPRVRHGPPLTDDHNKRTPQAATPRSARSARTWPSGASAAGNRRFLLLSDCSVRRDDGGVLRVEEGLFDRVRGQSAGDDVGGHGFLAAAKAAQQVGAGRVEQVVAVQA